MNRMTQFFKGSIVNKLALLVFLILVSVGGILAVSTISFFHVKNSLISMIDHDVRQVNENTRYNYNLRQLIASSNLLISTFTERESALKGQQDRLIYEIENDLKAINLTSKTSIEILQDYSQKLKSQFNQCLNINALLEELNTIQNALDTELATLDEIVVGKELAIAVEGGDEAESIKQLAIMLPGYREIFFEIIIEVIKTKDMYLGTKEIKPGKDHRVLPLLEEFDVGLNAMPIAWKEITPYIRNLVKLVSRYRSQITKVFENMQKFNEDLGILKISEKQVLSEISEISDQIIKNTHAIRKNTSDNITSTIRTTVLLSILIILILFVLGFFAVRLVQPLKRLSTGARKIGAGDLNYKVDVGLNDEIGQLAESFNHMTSNLRKTTVSKEYVQNILKSMNDTLIVLTPKGKIRTVNQAACELLDYNSEELIGEPVEKLLGNSGGINASDKKLGHTPQVEQLVEQPLASKTEKMLLSKNGSEIPVEFSASTMLDKDKRIQGIVCVASDITERKLAEAALKASEADYRRLFDVEPDAIIIVDAETKRIVDANPAALKLYGYQYSEIHGMEPVDLSAEPEKSLLHIQQGLAEDGASVSTQVVQRLHKNKEGIVFAVEIAHGFYTRDGRKMICAIMRDVRERKRMEDALSAEKERLQVTLRSIGDGVISTDLRGNIVLVNQVAEFLTGWKEEDAIDQPLTDVFHIVNELTRKRCENPVHKVMETGGVVGLANNTVLISKNGKEHVIADSAAPIKDQQNNIVGAVLVFRDITEKRKMEGELVKVQKLESLGVLAGGIAHDFNNFLTAIIGNLSLAMMDSNPGDQISGRLKEMEKASIQAKNLTQQLLTFSKGGEPVKQLASLAELVRNAAMFSLRGSSTVCGFSIPENLPLVEVDEGQLGQVINNLVLNADQAMPEGGIIEICAENIFLTAENTYSLPAGTYVRCSFQDHGVGISSDHLLKIFDPYFTTKQKGSGLGLTVAYSIIDNHNGRLAVESEIGHGTTFTIILPASEKSLNKSADEEKRLFAGTGKILVMDDETFIHDVAVQMLSKMGFEVLVANDGNEAIEMYREAKRSGQPFDLLIMDLTVPGGMGGKEAIRQLKEFDPDVKALVSSGYSNDPILSNFMDYGFQGVVKKPYRIQDLSDALRSVFIGNTA